MVAMPRAAVLSVHVTIVNCVGLDEIQRVSGALYYLFFISFTVFAVLLRVEGNSSFWGNLLASFMCLFGRQLGHAVP
jgi:hypothetical protein